ncbi:hypothetical protein D3C73_1322170 [compost metagenome]
MTPYRHPSPRLPAGLAGAKAGHRATFSFPVRRRYYPERLIFRRNNPAAMLLEIEAPLSLARF